MRGWAEVGAGRWLIHRTSQGPGTGLGQQLFLDDDLEAVDLSACPFRLPP